MATPSDGPHELVMRHMQMTARLKDLLRECTEARDAGNLAKAKKLFANAEKVHVEIQEMERRT